MLPQQHVNDPGISTKGVCGRLQLNTHAPYVYGFALGDTVICCMVVLCARTVRRDGSGFTWHHLCNNKTPLQAPSLTQPAFGRRGPAVPEAAQSARHASPPHLAEYSSPGNDTLPPVAEAPSAATTTRSCPSVQRDSPAFDDPEDVGWATPVASKRTLA